MLFVELKLDTKKGAVNERPHLLIFIKSVRKNKKKKKQTVKLQMGKMVKASIYIENVCAQTKVMNLSAPLFHSFFTC